MDGGVRRRPPRRRRIAAAVLVAALVLPAASSGAGLFRKKGPYRKGQVVAFTGQVADAGGRTLGGATVMLEVSHTSFRLEKMSRETSDTLRQPVTADGSGNYRVDWRWDRFYNTFALVVALKVREDGADKYEVFHRLEITGRVTGGNPVEVPLVLEDTAAFDELRAFLGSVDSDDEKRVYQEMGRPDRIDAGEAHYDPDQSWWYFAAGKVYRFRDGKLDQVVPFEPIDEE